MAGNWQFHWLQYTLMLSFLYLSFMPGWVYDERSADGARKSERSDHPRLTGSYGSNLWLPEASGWARAQMNRTGSYGPDSWPLGGTGWYTPDEDEQRELECAWTVYYFCFCCGVRCGRCRFRALFPMRFFLRRTAPNMPSVTCMFLCNAVPPIPDFHLTSVLGDFCTPNALVFSLLTKYYKALTA